MPQRRLILVFLALALSPNVFSIEVLRKTPDPKVIEISPNVNEGDELCVYQPKTILMCGKVIRVEPESAFLQLNDKAPGIKVGDPVDGHEAALEKVKAKHNAPKSDIQGMEKFRYGFVLGLNFASLSTNTNPTPAYASRVGMTLAAIADFRISDRISFEAALQYTEKGASQKDSTIEAVTRLVYLEIPFFLKIKILEGDLQPYFFAGPGFEVLLKAVVDTTLAGVTTRRDIKGTTPGSGFNAYGGLGAEYKLSDVMWAVGTLTYVKGLTDLDSTSGSTEHTGIRIAGGAYFRF